MNIFGMSRLRIRGATARGRRESRRSRECIAWADSTSLRAAALVLLQKKQTSTKVWTTISSSKFGGIMDLPGACFYSSYTINHCYLLMKWKVAHKVQNAASFELFVYCKENVFDKKAWVCGREKLRLLLAMKTGGESWALLSPEGTYYKLSEPNFFVGREDDMDLTLKVGLINFGWARILISSRSENRPEENILNLCTLSYFLTSPAARIYFYALCVNIVFDPLIWKCR